MLRIAVPLLLIVGLAACGDDTEVGEPEEVAAFTLRERIVTVDDAVVVWENASTVAEAHAAAEAAANLVVGSGGPDYGDRDGNGVVDGDQEFGVLPGLDGSPTGLANALEDNPCVVADVLGGSWADPGARWAEMDTVIAEWSEENNTVPSLASHPMRIVSWASLALASDDLAEATAFGSRSQLHIDVSLSAIDCDDGWMTRARTRLTQLHDTYDRPVTSIDPRTPVLVGAGQQNDRDHDSEPIDLMTRCADAAIADTSSPSLVDRIDSVRVVWGVWPYRDPGRLVADRLGAASARTSITTMGGNQVYDLVSDTAARIQRGELDVAVLCGAETLRTRRSDRARGTRTEYLPERDDATPDDVLGTDETLNNDAEREIGLEVVARFYAMAETALRHRLDHGIEEHRQRVAALWARASEVAAGNPNAWSRASVSAEDIATDSASNRPVASPYPKLMTSNLNVDQGGAVVMCSAEAAEAAGVPRDRWVFPWAGVGAADHWFPTNRWAFDESPAMRISGQRTLELAGLGVDDCDLVDLYSCFPVAVQLAQRELGIDPARPFTITGGLTFAAGPLNCYCVLPLTRAVWMLRDAPDQRALLTGNGGSFTKHSSLVLAGEPGARGFRTDDVQADVDALPSRPTPAEPVGEATLETYTVTFDREMRPERAIMACLDTDGRRHWATSEDPDLMPALLGEDCCERPIRIADGTAELA